MPTYEVYWHHVLVDGFRVKAAPPEAALDIALNGDPGDAFCSEVMSGLGHVVCPQHSELVLLDTREPAPTESGKLEAIRVALGLIGERMNELAADEASISLDDAQEIETLSTTSRGLEALERELRKR